MICKGLTMARNKVQFQKGLSEANFDELYGTEEQCHARAGRACAGLMASNVPIAAVNGHCVVKRGARQLFQCNACRKQTSVKAGTIFASSKLPLRLWFKTIYQRDPIEEGNLQHRTGPPAWRYPDDGLDDETQARSGHARTQRRKRFNGNVQMDDAYIGGERPGKRGRGAAGKTPFVAAVADNRRRQARSDPPAPRPGFRKMRDQEACQHSARSGMPTSFPMDLHAFTAVMAAGCTHTQS